MSSMAAVTSPTSASPSLSLMDWDEAAVHSYLSHIGLPQYEEMVHEQGITGEVLSMMDHAALLDLGITSVGHRLNLLRAIYELKKEQGIVIGEDDWKPVEAEQEVQRVQVANIERLWDLILEQQERLHGLERDHSKLLASLEDNGIVPMPDSAGASTIADGKQGGMRWRDFNGRGSDGEELEAGPSKVARRASQLFPSSLASSSTSANPPAPPRSADSATFHDSFTPTTTSASYPFDSPQLETKSTPGQTKPSAIAPPPFTRLMSNSSILGANAASPPASHTPTLQSSIGSITSLTKASHSKSLSTPPIAPVSTASPTPPSGPSGPSSTIPTLNDPASGEKSKARDAAKNAAKSFRVTLDDPCWKVLPAALKKYKINDDWKLYALFICFGNTERCLSYDEKPLMLFQKLKEGGQRPVFMLRHMRDIKSPIAVAQQKQAIKMGLPPGSTEDVLPKLKPASDTSASPTKASALQPARRTEEGQTPAGGAFPELPSPGLKEGEGGPRSAGTNRVLVDKDGNPQNVSYAVAIYPYIADRQDEFNVAVGATYVILSKAKGWYIVQRDPVGMGNITPDQAQSGWVPAGCLLELQNPIGVLSPLSAGMDPAFPGLAPIPPAAIMSSSYPGVVLMDWESRADDQVTLREGEKVKVYKKYCHWSYTIKQDTGERGWVPAWFIGKAGSGSTGGDSQPSSAATPTGMGHQQTPSTSGLASALSQSTGTVSSAHTSEGDGNGDAGL